MKAKAHATVRIELELDDVSGWGKDCTIGQVYDQAAHAALCKLNELVTKHGARIIGNPQVTAVLVPEKG